MCQERPPSHRSGPPTSRSGAITAPERPTCPISRPPTHRIQAPGARQQVASAGHRTTIQRARPRRCHARTRSMMHARGVGRTDAEMTRTPGDLPALPQNTRGASANEAGPLSRTVQRLRYYGLSSGGYLKAAIPGAVPVTVNPAELFAGTLSTVTFPAPTLAPVLS